MRVRVIKDAKPKKGARVEIKWFSQFGGLQVGKDTAYTDKDGWVNFTQPFNLFGAYGEGKATSGLSHANFEVKLDAFGNAPDTIVQLQTNPGGVGSDLLSRLSGASWPWLIAIGVVAIAIGYVLTQTRGLLKR